MRNKTSLNELVRQKLAKYPSLYTNEPKLPKYVFEPLQDLPII